MSRQIHPLLLCGGSGTRLWPLSRRSFPKQFTRLTGTESLFQASARRFSGPGFAAPTVITGADYRFIATEQLAGAEIAAAATLIEPDGRNTAPATLAGALELRARAPGALMLVAPCDHVIPDTAAFRAAVRAAVPAAEAGQIVTFGIRPDRAETGYGWLALSHKPAPGAAPAPQPLRGFVEKPGRSAAQAMLDDGLHLWNAGIFLFSTETILAAFETHQPGLLAAVTRAVRQATRDLHFLRLAPGPWADCADISLDHAVMEKAANLTVVPFAGAWSDLGDWGAVWREADHQGAGVVTSGPATAHDCRDSLLRAEDDQQALVGIGLTDIIAVAMPDAVLVAHRDRAQDVKQMVTALAAQGVAQAETLPRDYRPWGWFERLVAGDRFQVKRVHVHPGAALSLQSHRHRAEHWVVVAGTARVTIDGAVTLVTENQSVYIPIGAAHRLENPGKVALVIIEVQSGAYLGEDDITRHDDLYARAREAEG